jgi:DNA-binding response OmpR family regulator
MTSILPLILIVEDEPNAVLLLKLNLEIRGYQTVTASDGAEALRIADERHIDLVLLDLTLPDIDGFEVCRKLRAGFPGVGIIVVSAHATEHARDIALEAGADEYLVKPYGMEQLMGRVKRILIGQQERPNNQR